VAFCNYSGGLRSLTSKMGLDYESRILKDLLKGGDSCSRSYIPDSDKSTMVWEKKRGVKNRSHSGFSTPF